MNKSKSSTHIVLHPLWRRFALGIVVLSLMVIGANTLMVSFMTAENERADAEDANFTTNQQRTVMVQDFLQNAMNDVRLHLSVLASSQGDAAKDALNQNFFKINRGIAAIFLSSGLRLVNQPFFNAASLDMALLDAAGSLLKNDMNQAVYGKIRMRNMTSAFGEPLLALLFPSDFGEDGVCVLLSTESYVSLFASGAYQSLLFNGEGELLIGNSDDMTRGGVSSISQALKADIIPSSVEAMQRLIKSDQGQSYFSAYTKMGSFDGIILTLVPEDTVYEGVNNTVRRNLYLAGVILALALMFAWFFSRGISRPIGVLADAAREIEGGNYRLDEALLSQINTKRKDEVGLLGKAFIEMGESLEESHAELQRVNAGLEETVKERTAQLEEQTIAANAANKAKSDFLAMMSHEIRTPMNAVMGMIDLMETDNLRPEQIEAFSNIKLMSKSLLDIINEILDISKIEAGKMELVPVDYDLYALFDNVVMINRFSAEKKNLELISERDAVVPRYLYGDDTRVRQIYTNIISNAIKYTKEGSVTVRLGLEDDKTSVFSCKDSGIGIKEEDMPKLFSKFERLDEKNTRSIQGTGLGLPIVKRLVEMMQGSIEVESVYGEGSTFIVRLPLQKGDKDKVESEGDITRFVYAKEGSDIDILIADDMPMNLTVATGFMKKHGIDADTASCGLEAVEKVKAKALSGKPYDILFTDQFMPDIDGLEVSRRIRELGKKPVFKSLADMPIVALTANAVGEIKQQCLDAGMNDYLTKPIVPVRLNSALAKWLPQDKIIIGDAPDNAKPKEPAAPTAEIDTKIGLEYSGGDEDLYQDSLRSFCEGLEEGCAKLERYLSEENWEEYTIVAHGYKGATATIGALNISSLAKELEFAGRGATKGNQADIAACRTKTAELCSRLRRLGTLLSSPLLEKKQEKKYRSSDAELINGFKALKDACDEFNGSEAMRITGLLRKTEAQNPLQKRLLGSPLEEIRKFIDNIDYGEAADLIQTLLDKENIPL
jgi:signal transduction histidine kinase/DNA-binding NarL/FixJ family response regulator